MFLVYKFSTVFERLALKRHISISSILEQARIVKGLHLKELFSI